ncbi:hypothetical protein HDF16_001249 [Granulicella aggregans]|uniref:Secreted protein n=2 Tax=Granulicella aggregans TaxID=474949 RepID=A0A7W7ZBI4_9BACT|nr:hypothetical protein [Granulicella aggregans]
MYRIGLSVVALAAMTFAAQAQTIQVNKDNRTIAITTTDEAQAIADRAIVSIGFTVYGPDQDSTYGEASKVSNAVVKALKDAGVKAEGIESREQNLTAIDDNDKVRYSKGIRFVAAQSWGVTVPAKDAAETLHLAITAGANNSGGIDWQLVDDQALESEAATKALVHAQQIAEGMAKGLKVTLGPLVYASNQTPSNAQPRQFDRLNAFAKISDARERFQPLAISPAKISRSATVYAVFSLQ